MTDRGGSMGCRAIVVVMLTFACSGPPVDELQETTNLQATEDPLPSYRGEDRLIGQEWPPVPDGYTVHGGMTLGWEGDFTLTHVSRNDAHLVLLGSFVRSFVRRDDDGRARWRVEAVASLPQLNADEDVARADCSYRGVPDASIIAVGRWTDDGPRVADLVSIRHAIRPSGDRTRFESLSPQHVECAYDEDRT
jgi:hypothetical protein